jgi:hypothetical protein
MADRVSEGGYQVLFRFSPEADGHSKRLSDRSVRIWRIVSPFVVELPAQRNRF